MIYGLDEYYVGLIEEAKTPEEIKKILVYQFVQGKGIPEEVVNAIFEIDPTKKKSYTRWVLMQWEQYKEQIVSALKNGRLAKMFQTFKERAANGLDLTNMENFEKALEYAPDVDPILEKSGDPNAPENNFDIVFKSSEWIIAQPHTYEANRKLGEGCRWCTAGAFGDRDYYWKYYSNEGPIWVNFDLRKSQIAPTNNKEYPYTRYQFLFEHNDFHGELMDANDVRIKFVEMAVPEDVLQFYKSKNERYYYTLTGTKNPEEERINRMMAEFLLERLHDAVTISVNPELKIMPSTARTEDWHLPPENERVYLLYGEDNQDSLVPDFKVSKDSKVEKLATCVYEIQGLERTIAMNITPRGYIMRIYKNIYRKEKFGNATLLFDYETYSDGSSSKYAVVADSSSRFEPVEVSLNGCDFNEQISRAMGMIYFERLEENGLHSLDVYKHQGFSVAIYYDMPANGKRFEVDENGYVQGKILKYNLRSEFNYHVSRELKNTKNRFYLVFFGNPEYDDEDNACLNIYDTKEGKMLLKNNVLEIDDEIFGIQRIYTEDYGGFIYCADQRKAMSPIYESLFGVSHSNIERNKCWYMHGEIKEDEKPHDLIRVSEGQKVEIFHNMLFDESWWGYFLLLGKDGEVCLLPTDKDKEMIHTNIRPIGIFKMTRVVHDFKNIHFFDNENIYTILTQQEKDEQGYIKYNIKITSIPYDQEKIDSIDSHIPIYYPQELALQEVKNKFNAILEKINKPLRGEVYG